jgi:predicted RNA binding protein YcfA (HicA-like mRNA interferase family)
MNPFPSMKAKRLLAVLERQPLGYEVVRQSGSHRRMRRRTIRR